MAGTERKGERNGKGAEKKDERNGKETERKDERNGKEAEQGIGEGSEKVRHSVFRGDDPSRRFGRIVLTNTMLADHSCPAYAEGLQDALRTCV